MDVSHLSSSSLFSVRGKHCLVTGGGRGIGQMVAAGLVASGATVYVCSRSLAACEETARQLTAAGPGRCVALPAADLSGREACEALAAELGKHTRSLDVLVNNSGTTWGEDMATYPDAAWDKVMRLNVRAVFNLTRALLPALDAASVASKSPSRVVNVGSVAGIEPQPFPTYAYDASKAAVHHLTVKLAGELARRPGGASVTVNALAPGLVPTKMSKQLTTYVPEEGIAAGVPLGRVGAPGDMAGAVLFLASKAGEWVSGVVLPVDGGALGARGSIVAAKL